MENLITIKSVNAVRSLVKGKDIYAFCSEPLDSVKARGIYKPFSYLELHLASIDEKDFSSIKEQKDMVDKVKAPFEGDYICERAETFITYHDGIKDPQIFLVLKSK